MLRSYNIPDYRLERPEFRIFMSGEGSNLEYRIEGDLSAAAPPIRESKYLSREQRHRPLPLDAAGTGAWKLRWKICTSKARWWAAFISGWARRAASNT